MKVRVTKKLSDAPIEIPIHTEFIKLQDFLKFANAIESGGMAKTFIQEGEDVYKRQFKTFISRGNVMDMAIGVVIATAFGKISASLVADIIMPVSYTHLDVYKRQCRKIRPMTPSTAIRPRSSGRSRL